MKTKNAQAANPDSILFLVSRLQERAFRFLTAELKKRGIEAVEPSHGAILRQLFVHGPLPMNRLAHLIDRTKPTVTVLVNKLEKHGYVKRMADPRDNRVTLVQATDKASALSSDFEQVSRMMLEMIFKGFLPEERQALADYLQKSVNNF
ncbi:MAG: MarR family transcriptional regulator [Proteobacteria bacterium]|nr:MarR family transcriptional regulator [Pseudomonadota bacterium]MBU4471250.1 MarR family transcriptional regulator [Pseudomonadota bacterium]MCG2752851.1 MarR family transcriptional regulator [Desulfobacteraceae bacterium]